MGDDLSRRGLNPNARAFVPNPAARPFIPGQPYVYMPPPAQVQPQQQLPPGMPPPMVYMQPNICPQPPQQQQQQQPPAFRPRYREPMDNHQRFQAPPDNFRSPPPATHTVEAWDEGEDDADEAEALNTQDKEVDQEKGDDIQREVKEENDGSLIVEEEGSKTEMKNAVEASKTIEKKQTEVLKEENDEMAALTVKLKQAAFLDDSDRKEHVNIVFIGHVDAGKSTIGGHLMYLTGMVDKRTLEKYEKEAKDKGRESWYLSWALDTNDEEREKGKTVECGRAFFETEKKHFTILDAPGHKSFVPNMISGATQADLAVLVISARKGEFETGFDRGGQTREHAMLVKTAGVKYLVVLVNKMDDPTVNWDEERYKEIQNKLTPYLRKCGFSMKTDITYIPVSGLTGAFLKERPKSESGSWYTGPCFIEYIDSMLPSFSRDYEGPVRLVIAQKFNDMGTIVMGKIESGTIVKGQTVTVMPNRTNVQVIQLWSDDVEIDKIASGDNAKCKLKGIEDGDILPGFVLCSPDNICHVGKIFDAEVVILDHKSIIAPGYSCVLHLQTGTEEVTVKTVICTIDKKTGKKVRARYVKQDEQCIMRLESSEAFCLEAYKDFPKMGRFQLRDEGKTIAIGKVLKLVE